MRTYLREVLTEFAYPNEAQAVFLDTLECICKNLEHKQVLERLLATYAKERLSDFAVLTQEVELLATKTGVPFFTLVAVFYLLLTKAMKSHYIARGVEECVWRDTVGDLRVKCLECKAVKGVWGIFAVRWFFNVFRMNVFWLGRLEFAPKSFQGVYNRNGLTLPLGSLVIDTHIPGGEPMEHRRVLQSYAQAVEFFSWYYQVQPKAFWCCSWLLFPEHKQVLSEASNIRRFMDDFDIYDYREDTDYSQIFMRLFNREYTPDVVLEQLPADTALRQFYIDWMKQGKPTASGLGVIDVRSIIKKV